MFPIDEVLFDGKLILIFNNLKFYEFQEYDFKKLSVICSSYLSLQLVWVEWISSYILLLTIFLLNSSCIIPHPLASPEYRFTFFVGLIRGTCYKIGLLIIWIAGIRPASFYFAIDFYLWCRYLSTSSISVFRRARYKLDFLERVD